MDVRSGGEEIQSTSGDMNHRAMLSHDLGSTLESSYHEMPVDRLGAFSRGTRIGTLLWRLKYSHDAASYKPVVYLIAKQQSLESPIGMRLVEMALREWMLPQCQTCLGARELIVGPKRIICTDCGGYGFKRYSNRERDKFLGCRFKPWHKKYNKVWAVIVGGDRTTSWTMNEQLEVFNKTA